jgi:hypothetical protein
MKKIFPLFGANIIALLNAGQVAFFYGLAFLRNDVFAQCSGRR